VLRRLLRNRAEAVQKGQRTALLNRYEVVCQAARADAQRTEIRDAVPAVGVHHRQVGQYGSNHGRQRAGACTQAPRRTRPRHPADPPNRRSARSFVRTTDDPLRSPTGLPTRWHACPIGRPEDLSGEGPRATRLRMLTAACEFYSVQAAPQRHELPALVALFGHQASGSSATASASTSRASSRRSGGTVARRSA
jgi:hypothetical protein